MTPPAPRSLRYSQWMAAAAEERERLLRLLADLPAEQWLAPTDCAGWSVRDVVSHLSGAAASCASVRELTRQARLARRAERDGDLVDRMNEIQIDERRVLAPSALVDDFAATSRRGLAARRRIPPPLRGVPLPFGPPLGTRPLGYLMGRIYTRDAWMHRVDVSRAAGAEFEITSQHDGAIVEDLVAEWAAAHRQSYGLRLSGPAGGRWESGTASAGIEMDAVEFARTLSGRSPGEGLLAHSVPF